jgi:hypothetical protein
LLEATTVDAAEPLDPLDERDYSLLGLLMIAADEYVLVERGP